MTKIADDPTYNQPQPTSTTNTDSGSTPSSKEEAEHLRNKTQQDTNRKTTPTSTITNNTQNPSDDEGTHNATGIDDPVYSQAQTQASSRLSQVASHLKSDASDSHVSPPPPPPPTTRPRPRRKVHKGSHQSRLPADYSDILGTIKDLQDVAQELVPSTRGHDRQRASGKLTARQRIQALCGDTFQEIGSVTGTISWQTSASNPLSETVKAFVPSNNPQGFAQITVLNTGNVPPPVRKVYLTVDDFAIRSGHADGASTGRTVYGEQLALRFKVPVIKLVDGSSGGGSVTTIAKEGYSYLPHVHILGPATQQLNMGIPNLGAVLGPAIGLGAARVVSTHFSVMAADVGSLFNAGPKVVQGATGEEDLSLQDLGGWRIHCTNGTIDNMAPNEEGCLTQLRTILSYLPDCGALQAPPVLPPNWSNDSADRTDPSLRTLIPRRPSRAYNPYTLIHSLVDHTSFFEIGAHWGLTTIAGLARLAGHPIALLASNPTTNAGALDSPSCQKLTRLLRLADTFNLPIIQLLDVPGYAIGSRAERAATMKHGVQLAATYYTTTTPIFSVLVRRCYGVAGGIMLDSRVPWTRIAWPSANWGSLPLDGGIEVAHRAELKQIEAEHGLKAREQRYVELEEMYTRLMNPVRTAARFGVEEIVDPAVTRGVLCRWTEEMYGLPMLERLADRASGKIRPVFT